MREDGVGPLTIIVQQYAIAGSDVLYLDVVQTFWAHQRFGLDVKVGETQLDAFARWHLNGPQALSIGLVIHGPVWGFDDPILLVARHATTLDL